MPTPLGTATSALEGTKKDEALKGTHAGLLYESRSQGNHLELPNFL